MKQNSTAVVTKKAWTSARVKKLIVDIIIYLFIG